MGPAGGITEPWQGLTARSTHINKVTTAPTSGAHGHEVTTAPASGAQGHEVTMAPASRAHSHDLHKGSGSSKGSHTEGKSSLLHRQGRHNPTRLTAISSPGFCIYKQRVLPINSGNWLHHKLHCDGHCDRQSGAGEAAHEREQEKSRNHGKCKGVIYRPDTDLLKSNYLFLHQ